MSLFKLFRIETDQHSFKSTITRANKNLWMLGLNFLHVEFFKRPLEKLRTCLMLTFAFSLVPAMTWHWFTYPVSIEEILLCFSAVCICMEVLLKCMFLISNRQCILEMIGYIIATSSNPKNSEEILIYRKNHTLTRRLIACYILLYLFTYLVIVLIPVLPGIRTEEYQLPLTLSIPGVTYKTPVMYTFNMIMHQAIGVTSILMHTSLEVYFFVFITFSLSSFDIIKKNLNNIGKRSEKPTTILLTEIVEHHDKTLNFINRISEIYGFPFLYQTFGSALVICLTLLLGMINPYNRSIGILLTTLYKFSIFCYCGELVSTKSKELSESIYNTCWYNFEDIRSRRMILFMLRNSQRDVGLSVKWYQNLSMEVYAEILKLAYTLNTFLHHSLNK